MDLTHFDAEGAAVMVDVGAKPDTRREAVARGRVRMAPATLALIEARGLAKGTSWGWPGWPESWRPSGRRI